MLFVSVIWIHIYPTLKINWIFIFDSSFSRFVRNRILSILSQNYLHFFFLSFFQLSKLEIELTRVPRVPWINAENRYKPCLYQGKNFQPRIYDPQYFAGVAIRGKTIDKTVTPVLSLVSYKTRENRCVISHQLILQYRVTNAIQ